jgi:hypothetical protein
MLEQLVGEPRAECDRPLGPLRLRSFGSPVDDGLSDFQSFKRRPAAQKLLAERIKAMKVDVLAGQEVENIEALEEFVRVHKLRDAGYRHLVLVEGNDDRMIDVAVISKLPIGAVTSWRNRTYQNGEGKPVFSRHLLQLEILSGDRSKTLFTL